MFFSIFGKNTKGMLIFVLEHDHKCGGTSFNPHIMLKIDFYQKLEGGHENRYLPYFRHFHGFYKDENKIPSKSE